MQSQNNNLIRTKILEQLKAFANTDQKPKLDQLLTNQVYDFINQNQYRKIGIFSNLFYEFDTSSLIKKLLANQYQVFLPRIEQNDEMNFYQIQDFNFLYDQKFKIKQPIADIKSLNNDLDLFIVPSVSINNKNIRLGHGGGYYDRFFAKLKSKNYKISIAYDFMLNDEFDIDQFDTKIDRIFLI
ncbi:5-formyltetrahydrofolate cyclo-ligase [Mycoplasma sp. E35C]|uniref:5-formyltetrahydrofolate cyclo-ligase n=1 Tax=Mycoplasma sp. E35C TaxID=2801918 RepID=UPI001CA413C9|nr:5-formyltetrahydrofolate cyclo-ligase [Mycoplasma sp. E35C]QZX49461.1 5-formyltetrahydrofolate cyclo-ligase [Mycoplasma sp. E35C]